MAEGISEVKKVLGSALSLVNAEQVLASADYKLVYKQVLDLDDAEAMELAAQVGVLDLNDDQLEKTVEEIAAKAGAYAAFLVRLVKLVLPKPQ